MLDYDESETRTFCDEHCGPGLCFACSSPYCRCAGHLTEPHSGNYLLPMLLIFCSGVVAAIFGMLAAFYVYEAQ